jgi:ElaB/YqjD/DUF883 family membrane-anchored ribosome-binding protein
MCSLLNTEKHINSLENQITNIFSSLNQILEFSSSNGNAILELREIMPEKEDVLTQFNLVYSEIQNLKENIVKGNEEIKSLVTKYSEEVRSILNRVTIIEKAILPEER